jgi:putative membrane-bound dehydrogenase-like protein
MRRITPGWRTGAALAAGLCGWLALVAAAGPQGELSNGGPRQPGEEKATFRLPAGFHAELVACEPDVVDPVAMAFDEDGRIYVAEMRGYPNAGVATGFVTSGRVKRLEDRDGDGYFETATVYADNLRFPTAVMPWRGGLLVANAPDLLYLDDPTGSGKASRSRTLYTGFALNNIQQLINALQWGLDNRVYGCAGYDGGTVRSAEKPDAPPVTLRGRGVSFLPDVPASLEPTSGGGQYGLAPDDFGRWFTATNSQHLRHIVLPDHYLRRNPLLPVSAVTLDIPDHGAACKVFRISPFEAWRVERTTRRAGSADAARYPTTELVPGGYVTSGCSPVVYTADAFPPAYRGNTFVCDPANNLIHRDILAPNGATFTARRADDGCEFLASTDNWFRPVHLTIGPDGALYVLDFYREVIETPISLPEDIKKRLNLESRGRGRIWRIAADVPAGTPKPARPALSKATTAELVSHLADSNAWWRLTAQRLLFERQDRAAVAPLKELAASPKSAPGRAHALWTLEGLKSLDDGLILRALKDPEAGVREQALRLADRRLAASGELRAAVVALADDPSPRVRFQLAFTLGEADAPELTAALAKVAGRDGADPWTATAVLSSARRSAASLLESLVSRDDFIRGTSPPRLQLVTRLAEVVGADASEAGLARALALLTSRDGAASQWQLAVLDGLGKGLRDNAKSVAQLWENPPAGLKDAVARARALFEQAAATARDQKRPLAERLSAVRLLGSGPFAPAAAAATELLNPQTPAELQLAAIRALTPHNRKEVAGLLLASWSTYSPAVRREAAESLFARTDRIPQLLDALEAKKIPANQLEPSRLEQLRKSSDAKLRQRALAVLAGQVASDRQKVVEAYRAVLDLKADVARGRAAFRKNCATCHRLENQGYEVGPDLLSAIRGKPGDYLLIAILDPSREVDPRYLNYVVTTKKGQTLTGMIAAETASSVTLRRGERAEDTVLRGQIDTIEATAKSVMPEGLEMQLSKQDVADVIAYLQAVSK